MKKEEYSEAIEELISIIIAKDACSVKLKNVFPIARGGYYPAIQVAQKLELPIILNEAEISDETIVIDDLVDSGSTMQKYIGKCGLIGVVFVKEKSLDMMAHCGTPFVFARCKKSEEWITLPDEHETTIEDNIKRIIQYIGEDVNRAGLVETPARIVRMYKEIFRGYDPSQKPKITTFDNDEGIESIVFDAGDYYSMCEHHILPFFGRYYFAYIPSKEGRILGISKVARVVGYCAARLQLQERLAHDIIDMLSEALDGKAAGFAICMKGMHLCKTMRGVKNNGKMSVAHFTGVFKENPDLRKEFYNLVEMNQNG